MFSRRATQRSVSLYDSAGEIKRALSCSTFFPLSTRTGNSSAVKLPRALDFASGRSARGAVHRAPYGSRYLIQAKRLCAKSARYGPC